MADKPEPPNIAILGCGRMGRVHGRRILADGRARICALFDKDQDVAETLRAELAEEIPIYNDLNDLLQHSNGDAAIVCTPTRFHYEQTISCLRKRMHVLCEKPLADNRRQIVQLAKESRAVGRVLMVGYQRRYWATYRHLRNELRSGRFGKVRALTFHNGERWQQTIAGTWRDDPKLNVGGFLGDAGSHRIDALYYTTGLRATEVSATTEFCGSRVEINAKVTAQLEGGVPVRMTFTGNANSLAEDLFIHCENGVLILHDGKIRTTINNQVENVELPENESGPESISNPTIGFLDTILDNAPNLAPAECALPVFDFTDALLKSSETEEVVRIAEEGPDGGSLP